jgi:hypothetical protein
MNNYLCIVSYIGATPIYYCGYYKSCNGDEHKPVMSVSFDDALKLGTKQEAEKLLFSIGVKHYKVEEHALG